MFHSEQAPGHRLDEIFLRLKSKAKEIIRTVTGNLPLIVPEAVASAIRSLTRYGICTQDGTPTPDAPVDIMCNNGVLKWDSVNQRVYADGTSEVLTVGGPNLLNTATNITGKYITVNGRISNWDDAQFTDLIPVTVGETYTWSLVSNRSSGGNNRCHGYDSTGNWVQQIAFDSTEKGIGLPFLLIATIPNGISYVRLSYGINDTEAMFKKQNYDQLINTFYEAANTDTAPIIKDYSSPVQSPHNTIWKVGVYFEAIPGGEYAFSHDVYAKGTYVSVNALHVGFYEKAEDVTDRNKCLSHLKSFAHFTVPNEAHYVVIEFEGLRPFTFSFVGVTKFDNDYQPYVEPQTASVPMLLSVGDVKDEVELIRGRATRRCAACLYDGTQDVGDTYLSTTGGKDIGAIIVYPLAEPTAESITPQELTLTEGTNIIDATANVEPLTAKCKYQAVSALDILSALLGTRSGTEDMSIKDAKDVVNVILGDDNK